MSVLLKNDGVTSRSLQTNKEYSIYRQDKHLPESYKIKDRSEWKKFVVDYYRELRDTLLEAPYGVYMPGVGYFFNFLSPNKRVAYVLKRNSEGVLKRTREYNFHTEGHGYFATFVGVKQLGYYKMDGCFSTSYKKQLVKNILDLKDYGSMVNTLKESRRL